MDLRDWPRLLAVMKHFVIVRAEFMYITNQAEYAGYSMLFDVNDISCVPPYYEITVQWNDADGNELADPVVTARKKS